MGRRLPFNNLVSKLLNRLHHDFHCSANRWLGFHDSISSHDTKCKLPASTRLDKIKHSLLLLVTPWNFGDQWVMKPRLLAEKTFDDQLQSADRSSDWANHGQDRV